MQIMIFYIYHKYPKLCVSVSGESQSFLCFRPFHAKQNCNPWVDHIKKGWCSGPYIYMVVNGRMQDIQDTVHIDMQDSEHRICTRMTRTFTSVEHGPITRRLEPAAGSPGSSACAPYVTSSITFALHGIQYLIGTALF